MTTKETLDGYEGLPGHELVTAGVRDLEAGKETVAALLVSMAAPRLRGVGIDIPVDGASGASHRLYEALAEEDRDGAHSRYNALVRRLVSFARAAEHARRG